MDHSRNLPHTRLQKISITTMVLLFAIAGVRAITGTSFEATDGDLVSQGGFDWDTLAGTPALSVAHDLPSGQADDSFSGKEDDSAPDVVYGSIPGNKSDLLRFYIAHESREESGIERDFLYLGWVRSNTLGSANMDFEFNQSRVLSPNGTTPVRTPGDMLITFGFSGNGNQVDLGMSRWTATGPCEASPTTPCWGPLIALSGSAEGSVNLAPVLDPIEGVTLPELTFGEAVIDLTSAGVFDRETCQTFGEAYVKSRSSESFTASLKDYVKPQHISVSNCSILTIRKNAVPDDAQDFTFLATGGPSPQSFDLDDDGSNANALPSSRTWETPVTGPASVSESPAAGWDLTGITCAGDAIVAQDADGHATGEVSFQLAKGGAVDCTFTNTKRGRILVDEVTIPGGDPQSFPFTLQGGPDAVLQNFALADASPLHDSGTLRPGTYNVLQGSAGDAWDLTGAVCSDGSSPAAVSLQPGETVTCTFTNTKRGRIAVDVVVTPSGDPQPFSATLTGGPSAVNDAFTLRDADPARLSGYLRPGGYATAVPAPAGYFPVSASCDDGSPVGAVALSPGETVTCTFAFVKGSRIVVDKATDPAGDSALFGFALSGTAMATESFQLADATAPRASGWLAPGSGYRVDETVPAGWDLTGLSCASTSGASASSRSGNGVSITLGAADEVTCTFTNTKRGRIAVDVVVTPSGDPQPFSATLTGGPSAVNDAFTLRDADPARLSGYLLPGGGYAAAVATPAGYFAVSSSCDDGSPVGSIALSPGETVTCTFAFVKGSRIVVDKVTDPAGDPALFGFTLSGASMPAPEAFQLADAAAPRASGWLLPGASYRVDETVTAGWDLSGIACVSSSGRSTFTTTGGAASIALGPADQVTCTFTNTKRGRILVDEVTIPSGDPQSFPFTLQGGPDAVAQSFSLTDPSPLRDSGVLKPGSYTVAQGDDGPQWDLTSAVCSDGSSPAAVSLQPGETVTCTFTNTKRGRIAVDVVVTPSGDPQLFGATLTGGPSAVNDAFTLRDADPARLSGYLLPGGGYAAAVATPAGYFAVTSSCDDGSPVGAVSLSPGETVTCTFTFVKGSRIVVDKVTDPANDTTLFGFTLSGTGIPAPETFQLAHATAPRTSGWLAPGGQYQVAEATVAGWDLTGVSCASATGASPSSRTGDAASITLGPGDVVTCTFSNTKRGTIVIVQNAIPDDPQDFSFTLTGPGTSIPFLLDDDADPVLASSRSFTQMLPGSYAAAQGDPGPAWDLQSVTCTDAAGRSVGSTSTSSRTASFTLPPGGVITCVFTDIKRGMVVVEKLVVNAPVPGASYDPWQIPFTFNPSWGAPFVLKHGQQNESPWLRGGTSASVSESSPDGWSTSSVCIYPDGSSVQGGSSIGVTVPAGQTVHCTFINELVLHAGSSGYWRNWDNHYTDDELRKILTDGFDDSPIYAALFLNGALIGNAVAVFDGIFGSSDNSTDHKVLVELTALMANLTVSSSSDPSIRALQENDDVCRDCIVDLSGIPGAEDLIDEWSGNIVFGAYTVGDIIDVAEAVWHGNVALKTWSFDPLTESEKVLLAKMLESVNQGTILTADPATYPDRPGCLKLPGLPPATEGIYYSAKVNVITTSAFHVDLVGKLPPGLILDPWTAEITGVPGFVGPAPLTFTFSLTFSIPGEGKTETRPFSITVTPWPRIISLACDDAVVGVPYSDTLQGTGGAMPRSWSIVGGGLPAGLALDTATGTISGTPAGTTLLAPSMALFTVALTDANGASTTAVVQMALIPSGGAVCSPAPAAPTQNVDLSLWQYGTQTYIYWNAVANATSYDAVYGSMTTLRSSGGNFSTATVGCLGGGVSTMPLTHSVTPLPGRVLWFLLRARNCGGTGSFDSGTADQIGSRDVEIEVSGRNCQ